MIFADDYEFNREAREADLAAEAAKREVERNQRRHDYAETFSGERGERVLEDLLQRYGFRDGVELPSYRVGADHANMAFIEGQKEVVRHIIRTIGQSIKQPKGD